MKRTKLRKASKRVSCSKRYKIQKKVREHNRKLRKEAKKKGGPKRTKKDPGVPNSAPFKEEVLREAEQRRLQIEAEQERKRQAKKEERTKKRKQESGDTEPNPKKTRRAEPQATIDKSSKEYYCSQLNKVIDVSDVVLEVLDARDPQGCRCPELEEAVLQRNKKLVLVLNKIDLVPKDNVEKWIQCLQAELPVVAFKASTQMKDKTVLSKKQRQAAANDVIDKSRGAACFGTTCLSELLASYAANIENKASLKVGVVGFPNVGKSSIINSLKGVLACNVGVTRGTTKTMQEVHLLKNVNLIDSPGIVAAAPSSSASMALRGQCVVGGLEAMMEAVKSLLDRCSDKQVMLQYNVGSFRNGEEFLTMLAKKHGYLKKGGVPNMEQAATSFLSDWTGAKLSFHCEGQEHHTRSAYITDAVVAELQKGWDLNHLKTGNTATLKDIKCPTQASSIGFLSPGPTTGLLLVSLVTDVVQEKADNAQDEISLADLE